jgi:hypothetical protein
VPQYVIDLARQAGVVITATRTPSVIP